MAQHKKDYKPEDIMFPNQAIITSELVGEMKQSYMEYAMSVIVGRALPDVRDGLKPVHRRILYAMYEDNLTSDRPFRKSATCVGDAVYAGGRSRQFRLCGRRSACCIPVYGGPALQDLQ